MLFIDASKDYSEGKAQNFLQQGNIEKTAQAFDTFETAERYCTVSELDEIKENDYNLNISRYVDTTKPEGPIDIHEVMENLDTLQVEEQTCRTGYLDFSRSWATDGKSFFRFTYKGDACWLDKQSIGCVPRLGKKWPQL